MHLHTRNVNTAFNTLVEIFKGVPPSRLDVGPHTVHVVRKNSRNGPVLMIEEPVTITYSRPTERVLFNPVRDANPFFHMYESLWMLAGRNDVGSLAYYCGNVKQYSDDGKTFNGAYGHRWRRQELPGHSKRKVPEGVHERDLDYNAYSYRVDQLNILVSHLKANPKSRRAVLSMWNVDDDLLKIGDWRRVEPCPACTSDGVGCPKCGAKKSNRLEGFARYESSKDVCCNLNVMFALRGGPTEPYESPNPCTSIPGFARYLDMTVTNRSNDMLWGMLGTNYTTFTFLQEYMAARLGVEVGKYHHITNNLHVYCERPDWRPVDLLSVDPYEDVDLAWYQNGAGTSKGYRHFPLVRDPETFEHELPRFVEHHSRNHDGAVRTWQEPFLQTVAQPLLNSFHNHKRGETEFALLTADSIEAEDWRLAATGWLERRRERREQRAK